MSQEIERFFIGCITVALLFCPFGFAAEPENTDAGIRRILDKYRVAKPVDLTDLGNWKAQGKPMDKTKWINKDGKLVLDLFEGKPKNYSSVSLISPKEYRNFILDFTWIAEKGTNSGIKYRFKDFGKPHGWLGCEYQILDDAHNSDGKKNNGRNSAASLYGLFAPDPKKKTLNPHGQTNTGRIVVLNNRIEHWLNGEKVLECEVGSAEWEQAHAAGKFAETKDFGKNPVGLLQVQDHNNPVTFEKIVIREIGEKKTAGKSQRSGLFGRYRNCPAR